MKITADTTIPLHLVYSAISLGMFTQLQTPGDESYTVQLC
jgi:hypothetical protein